MRTVQVMSLAAIAAAALASPARADHDKVLRAGTGGARPLEMDEVTVEVTSLDPGAAADRQTVRLGDAEWWMKDVLAKMTAGEKRRIWYEDQGATCDHFG